MFFVSEHSTAKFNYNRTNPASFLTYLILYTPSKFLLLVRSSELASRYKNMNAFNGILCAETRPKMKTKGHTRIWVSQFACGKIQPLINRKQNWSHWTHNASKTIHKRRIHTSGTGFWITDSTATTIACTKSSPPVPIAVNPLTVGYEFTLTKKEPKLHHLHKQAHQNQYKLNPYR